MATRIYIGGNIYGAGNIGDDAVLQGLLGLLAEAAPDATFCIGTHHARRLDYLPPDLEYVDAEDSLAVADAVRSCDVVVVGGGTMIGDELGGEFPIGANSDLLGVARLHGKRTAMLGIGANRLTDPAATEIGRALMSLSGLITTRDAESRDVCLSLGASSERMVVTADPAFLLGPKESDRTRYVKERLRAHGPLLGVSLANEVWARDEGYKRAVARACDRITKERGLHPVFFCNEVRPGNYYDYESSKHTAFLMDSTAELLGPTYYSPEEMIDIISCFDAVLGMRMHALIFAAVAGTPFVALSRVDKVDNFMRLFGLESSGSVEECDAERLAEDVCRALDGTDTFRTAAAARVDELRDACWRNIELFRDLLAEERETWCSADATSLQRLLSSREAEVRRLREVEARLTEDHCKYERSVLNSMSWQITAPLRRLKAVLRDPKRPLHRRLFGSAAYNVRRLARAIKRCFGDDYLRPDPASEGARTLYHVVDWYDATNRNTARRMRIARESWERLYASPARFDKLWYEPPPDERTARTALDDPRDTRFVKDVIDQAVARAGDGAVVYTNADICLVPETPRILREMLDRVPCLYSFRTDFRRVRCSNKTLVDLPRGMGYIGCDLFAFRPEWWIEVRAEFPDLLLGYEGWDFVMRKTMERSGFAPSALPSFIYHEEHTAYWKEHIGDAPGQTHNRAAARRWAVENGYEAEMNVQPPFLF